MHRFPLLILLYSSKLVADCCTPCDEQCLLLINPAARPSQKCSWGGYLTLDPLILKAQENGLEFAVETEQGESPKLNGKSRTKNLHFNWDWGFRVGLGANLPKDGWDLSLNWMRLKSDDHNSEEAEQGETLLPVLAHPGGIAEGLFGDGRATRSSSRWRLHFDELDFHLGRQFFVSKWLTLKPLAGIETAWINQTNLVKYDGLLDVAFREGRVHLSSDYWGAGLKAGLDTQWGILCGFSFIANYSASILYGFFKTGHSEQASLIDGMVEELFTFTDFYHISRLCTDFLLGLRYDTFLENERYHIGIQAGWEQHLFFGQNQFIRFSDGTAQASFFANQGDLSLQGFSAQMRFDF